MKYEVKTATDGMISIYFKDRLLSIGISGQGAGDYTDFVVVK
jgi:hypothetical protein